MFSIPPHWSPIGAPLEPNIVSPIFYRNPIDPVLASACFMALPETLERPELPKPFPELSQLYTLLFSLGWPFLMGQIPRWGKAWTMKSDWISRLAQ